MTENTTHDTSILRYDVLQKIFPTSWASEYPGKPRLSRRERRNREQRRIIARKVADVFDADRLQQQVRRAARSAGEAYANQVKAQQREAEAEAALSTIKRSDTPLSPEPVLHDVLVSALTEVLEKVVVTTQGRTFKADGAHIMTFADQADFQKATCAGQPVPGAGKSVNDAAQAAGGALAAGALGMTTAAEPLTRDDVRAIASEEIGKLGGLLLESPLNSNNPGFEIAEGDNEVRKDDLRKARVGILTYQLDKPLPQSYNRSGLLGDRPLVDGLGDTCDKVVVTHNSSPSVDDAGAHSVGDGPGAGDASATPATEVTLNWSEVPTDVRYDHTINGIVVSSDGRDVLNFRRDDAIRLVDRLLSALEAQVKSGGLA